MTETILITGSSGFLGRRIVRFLQRTTDAYLMTTSRQQESFPNHLVRDLSEASSELMKNVDTVIHFAGLAAHKAGSESDFQIENVDNALKVAKASIEAGVKRFIFISTTDVHGTSTHHYDAFNEQSPFKPETAYARSKLAAEEALAELCKDHMNLIILRLPLVYHIDAVNEFGQYVKMVREARPLPLAKIDNGRTLLALCNFESALGKILHRVDLHNETLILSDLFSLSTTKIFEGISTAAIVPLKLFYVPKTVAKTALTIFGRKKFYQTFWGNCRVSSEYAQILLDWHPVDRYVVNLSK